MEFNLRQFEEKQLKNKALTNLYYKVGLFTFIIMLIAIFVAAVAAEHELDTLTISAMITFLLAGTLLLLMTTLPSHCDSWFIHDQVSIRTLDDLKTEGITLENAFTTKPFKVVINYKDYGELCATQIEIPEELFYNFDRNPEGTIISIFCYHTNFLENRVASRELHDQKQREIRNKQRILKYWN